MKPFLALTALLIFLFLAPASTASRPATMESQVEHSIVVLNVGENAHCTAWAINPMTFITAAHCQHEGETLSIEGKPVHIHKQAKDGDIMMLDTEEPTSHPGLQVSPVEPMVGDEVEGFGFAGPLPFPTFLRGQLINPMSTDIPEAGKISIYNTNWINGQSGGPIVNTKGEVVSVIFGGFNNDTILYPIGFGTTYKQLKDFLK